MERFSFTREEYTALRNVVETVEYDLEDIDTKPQGWSDAKYSRIFQSILAKLRTYSTEIPFSEDECLLLFVGINYYVKYADRFTEDAAPAEIVRQLRALEGKLQLGSPA